LETVGAQLVADVQPFERMKLRMLNGSHSTLAYLGYLAGYDYVDEAISNPAFHTLLRAFMTEEVMATLPGDLGDLAAYRDTLLDRFANPTLRHRTWQIAMDGSQKLPQRLLGTLRDLLSQGRPITLTALGVAAWMRYVTGVDERGRAIDVRDPLAERLRTTAASAGGMPARLVDSFLRVSEIFGHDLPQCEAFRAELTSHLDALLRRGARETVHEVTNRMRIGD
jgi:fructuronate reductase